MQKPSSLFDASNPEKACLYSLWIEKECDNCKQKNWGKIKSVYDLTHFDILMKCFNCNHQILILERPPKGQSKTYACLITGLKDPTKQPK
jgi:DNA-directed RNA polymerase subunit RPC12/RpoP